MKSIAFYIHGIDHLFPEASSLDNLYCTESITDMYFPNIQKNANYDRIDGYICIAEQNRFGEVDYMLLEPIHNGTFLNSTEILSILNKQPTIEMIDVSMDFYEHMKPLNVELNKHTSLVKMNYALLLQYNAIEFIKTKAKEFFQC